MRISTGLLSIVLAFGLVAGCDDGEERRPVEDDARRLISIEVDRSTSVVGAPILLRITVYSTDGVRLPGQHVVIESSRKNDVLEVNEGNTDEGGELLSTLSATVAGRRSITARVGDSKGEISLVIAPSSGGDACTGGLLLEGHSPVEHVQSDFGWPSLGSGDFDGDGACETAVLSESFTVGGTLIIRGASGLPDVTGLLENRWHPSGLVTGDFDGDGRIDLAVVGSSVDWSQVRVEWFSVGADRVWQRIAQHEFPGSVYQVVSADVDGDGRSDLLVESVGEANIRSVVLAGDEPVLGDPVSLWSTDGQRAWAWTSGDFDGDGRADLAIVGGDGTSILTGNGDGTFSARRTLEARLADIVAADLDGDGRDDLAGLEFENAKRILSIVRSGPDGSFATVSRISDVPNGILRRGDVDGDGVDELLYAAGPGEAPELFVVHGDTDGVFSGLEWWTSMPIPALDFSVCAGGPGRSEVVLLGRNSLARVPIDAAKRDPLVRTSVDRPRWLGDLEGDGSVEVVAIATGVGRRLAVEADGTMRTVREFEVHFDLLGADLRSVGRVGDEPSIVEVGWRDRGPVLVVHSLETGASREVDTLQGIEAISVADVDGDGLGDVVFSTWSETLALLADGKGDFRLERVADFSALSIGTGDLDGDGSVELILADWTGVVAVPVGSSFGPPQPLSLMPLRLDASMFTGDFDGDGKEDIAIGGSGETVYVYLQGADGFEPALEYGIGGWTEAGTYGRLAGGAERRMVFLESGSYVRVVPITCAEP